MQRSIVRRVRKAFTGSYFNSSELSKASLSAYLHYTKPDKPLEILREKVIADDAVPEFYQGTVDDVVERIAVSNYLASR